MTLSEMGKTFRSSPTMENSCSGPRTSSGLYVLQTSPGNLIRDVIVASANSCLFEFPCVFAPLVSCNAHGRQLATDNPAAFVGS